MGAPLLRASGAGSDARWLSKCHSGPTPVALIEEAAAEAESNLSAIVQLFTPALAAA
jgi:hypothetical protein